MIDGIEHATYFVIDNSGRVHQFICLSNDLRRFIVGGNLLKIKRIDAGSFSVQSIVAITHEVCRTRWSLFQYISRRIVYGVMGDGFIG